MKIKTQFRMTLLLFGAFLVIIAALLALTNRHVEITGEQERIASEAAQDAHALAYLANEYLIYREPVQLRKWEARFETFSAQVARLKPEKSEEELLVRNIEANQRLLKEIFDNLVSAAERPSRKQDGASDTKFLQMYWSRMAISTQALAEDASRLFQLLRSRAAASKQTNMVVVFVILGIFTSFFLISYWLIQRRILKSLMMLQAGAAAIGSGNLDCVIQETEKDEIGELSRAFNDMTRNLKVVTASKSDLENEIAEHRLTEAALKQSEKLFRAFFENVAVGTAQVDLNGKFIEVNEALCRITGYSREEIMSGLSPRQLTHPDDRARADTEIQEYLSGKVPYFDSQKRFLRKDGSVIWVQVTAGLIHNSHGKPILSAATIVDITERKRAEGAREKLISDLETANKEMESFTYSVSHDLRAPLRAIDGFSAMLLKSAEGKLDSEEKRKFGIIRENTVRMDRLIADLLALSRLGRADMSLTSFDLKDLCEEIWREQADANPERTLELKMGECPKAYGDSNLIRQVLSNLLANAVKFSKNVNPALIEMGGRSNGGENIYYVRDNGAGFEMKYYDKLFGVFQRLHDESEYEGLGVGLAIVQRIIQRHGGRVWAEAKVGEGATFYFSLPNAGKDK